QAVYLAALDVGADVFQGKLAAVLFGQAPGREQIFRQSLSPPINVYRLLYAPAPCLSTNQQKPRKDGGFSGGTSSPGRVQTQYRPVLFAGSFPCAPPAPGRGGNRWRARCLR